jgi:hypothetical protein
MLVTEKISGVLLAALAVQLMLDGLDSVGVIHLAGHRSAPVPPAPTKRPRLQMRSQPQH